MLISRIKQGLQRTLNNYHLHCQGGIGLLSKLIMLGLTNKIKVPSFGKILNLE